MYWNHKKKLLKSLCNALVASHVTLENQLCKSTKIVPETKYSGEVFLKETHPSILFFSLC